MVAPPNNEKINFLAPPLVTTSASFHPAADEHTYKPNIVAV